MVEGLFAFFDFKVLRFGYCGGFGRYRPPHTCSPQVFNPNLNPEKAISTESG